MTATVSFRQYHGEWTFYQADPGQEDTLTRNHDLLHAVGVGGTFLGVTGDRSWNSGILNHNGVSVN